MLWWQATTEAEEGVSESLAAAPSARGRGGPVNGGPVTPGRRGAPGGSRDGGPTIIGPGRGDVSPSVRSVSSPTTLMIRTSFVLSVGRSRHVRGTGRPFLCLLMCRGVLALEGRLPASFRGGPQSYVRED